jgi:ribonuclease BN (tRNA processing enzyme)
VAVVAGQAAPGGRVRVTVAGSGDAFGSGGRLQACVHLQALGQQQAVLLDCGASALAGLRRCGLEPNEVTVVAVSHLHGDHFGGLPYLLLDGQFRHRQRPLHLVGPPGTRQRLEQAMEVLFPGSTGVRRRFATHVHELPPGGTLQVEQVAVQAVGVDHAAGAPALGLRLRMAGRVLAYSGDTAWTDTLIELADGADLFVCEAYTASRRVPYHLDLPTLRANLPRLRCARLLLTHPGPDVLQQRDHLGLELADDGTVIEL